MCRTVLHFPRSLSTARTRPAVMDCKNNSLVHYAVDNVGYNIFNNWLWTKGRHTFNIGGEYHHYYQLTQSDYSGGHFNFSQEQTSTPNPSDPNSRLTEVPLPASCWEMCLQPLELLRPLQRTILRIFRHISRTTSRSIKS